MTTTPGTDWQDRIAQALRQATDDGADRAEDYATAVLPIVRAAQAQALRDAVEEHAITIPDALGYKVSAVAVEDLLDTADRLGRGIHANGRKREAP